MEDSVCNSSLSKSQDLDPHYIWTGKVAVALTMIRNKPAGMTSRQYAEQLCSQYMRSQLYSQERLARITQLLANQHGQPASSLLWPTSHQEEKSIFDTPPCSSEARQEDGREVGPKEKGKEVTSYTHLLHSLLCLRSLSLSLWSMPEVEEAYIVSVKRAYDRLTLVFTEDKMALPELVFCQICKVCCDMLDGQTGAHWSLIILDKTIDLLQAVVVALINHNSLDQSETQQMRWKLLLCLGRTRAMRVGVLTLLARCLAHFGSALREVLQNGVACQPHVFENIYYIFHCMECLLCDVITSQDEARSNMTKAKVKPDGAFSDSQNYGNTYEDNIATVSASAQDAKTNSATMSAPHTIPPEIIDTINIQLEDSLLIISEQFPCFAFAVWHLKGLLEQINKN